MSASLAVRRSDKGTVLIEVLLPLCEWNWHDGDLLFKLIMLQIHA